MAVWTGGESMQDIQYCPHCGKQTDQAGEFCAYCGGRLWREEEKHTGEHRRPRALMIAAAVMALLGVLAIVVWYAGVLPFFGKPFSRNTGAIEKAAGSVVMVYCYDSEEMREENLLANGSGELVYDSRTVVTNWHVIEGARAIRISTEQDISYDVAGIIAYDEYEDIAFLWLTEAVDAKPLAFGDSAAVKKGAAVVAIGSPLGFKNTVSTGVLGGRIYADGVDYLQFTAPISPGSSGGALLNDAGELIGITAGHYVDGQNINYAIPVEIAEAVFATRTGKLTTLEHALGKTDENTDTGNVEKEEETAERVEFAELTDQNTRWQYDGKRIVVTVYVFAERDNYVCAAGSKKEAEEIQYTLSKWPYGNEFTSGYIMLEKASGYSEMLPGEKANVDVIGFFYAKQNTLYVEEVRTKHQSNG